jgi:hypothetical protein
MSGQLSHTPSSIVRQLLIDLVVGSDGGASWPVYADELVDLPDDTIAVIDTGGVSRGRFMVNGEQQINEGIQIIVRAADTQTAWQKASKLMTSVTKNSHLRTVNVVDPEGYGTASQAYTIFNVSLRSGPLPIHPAGDSSRKQFSLNFVITIRQNT